jgi:hypothetical protein
MVNEPPRSSAGFSDLSEIKAAFAATDLHELANQLASIAEELRQAIQSETGSDMAITRHTAPAAINVCDKLDNLSLARQAYALRRLRNDLFGRSELFGEPAWDIVLDLYIAHCEGKPVSVSSACIGSAAPPTTGLRWLGVLAEDGLSIRENDAADNRRVMVRLSETGIAAMERFLEAARN